MPFSTIKSQVQDYLARTDLAAVIPFFINTAMKRLERAASYSFMETNMAPVTLNAGVYSFTVPTQYKRMVSAFVLDPQGIRHGLTKMPYNSAMAYFPDFANNVGTPQAIAYNHQDNLFIVRPTPDQTYTTDIILSQFTPALVNDTDSNFWTEQAPELLIEGALQEAQRYLALGTSYATQTAQELQKWDIEEDLAGSPQTMNPCVYPV